MGSLIIGFTETAGDIRRHARTYAVSRQVMFCDCHHRRAPELTPRELFFFIRHPSLRCFVIVTKDNMSLKECSYSQLEKGPEKDSLLEAAWPCRCPDLGVRALVRLNTDVWPPTGSDHQHVRSYTTECAIACYSHRHRKLTT